VSVEEMIEMVRAMIADRNTSEHQRLALTMLLRMAMRGRHISSTRLPAVSSAVQAFARVGEILRASNVAAEVELKKGLDSLAAAGPEGEEDGD
jgi:hypothetical protein